MSKVIQIGRKNKLCGKTVFEILANLKNFGIGRILKRNSFGPIQTFYKIVDVEPQMDDKLSHGRVWVQEVSDGKRFPEIREIAPWHPDYALVHKNQEPDFASFPLLGRDNNHVVVLPATHSVPPLMAEFMNRKRLGFFPNPNIEGLDKEVDGFDAQSLTQFEVPAVYSQQILDPEEFDYFYRVANKGEKPTLPADVLIEDKFKVGIKAI